MMNDCKKSLLLVLCCVLAVAFLAGSAAAGQKAQKPAPPKEPSRRTERDDRLLEGWLSPWRSVKEDLAERRLKVGLGLTTIFQASVGGLNDNDAAKGTFTSDLSVQYLAYGRDEAGVHDDYGKVGLLIESRAGDGISARKVGSLMGVNDDPFSGGFSRDQVAVLTELWWEQTFADRKLIVTLGKLHANNYIDNNAYANDQTRYFMASPLVFNRNLPLPQDGLGFRAKYTPLEWLDFQFYASDANADVRESGFNTAFEHGADLFSAYQVAFRPTFGELRGNYRFLVWVDGRRREKFRGGTRSHDTGFTLSFDQEITSRLGVFCGYGFARDDVNVIEHSWRAGVQLSEPIPGRQEDLVGLGVAQGIISQDARRAEGLDNQETIFELYYRCQVASWLQVSPDVQVVLDPGADQDNDTAVVFGLRFQADF